MPPGGGKRDPMKRPKLIVSDIDGTLIPYGQSALPKEAFSLIRRLSAAGILFCPASGRQYHSLRRLFASIADEICFLCANGAVIFGAGGEETAPVLSKTAMPRRDAEAVALDILSIPSIEVVISGQNISYLLHASATLLHDLQCRLHNRVAAIESPAEIGEEIIKVSAFCPNGVEEPLALLAPRWGSRYGAAVAGPHWIDFTLADKGDGLRRLCAALEIDPAEVWAFGDNYNDVPMLELAGTPWLMRSAGEALRKRFPRQCDSVITELSRLLAAI